MCDVCGRDVVAERVVVVVDWKDEGWGRGFQRAIVGSDLEAMFGGEKTRIVSSSASRLVGLPRWERGLTLPKRYCLDSSPSLIIETVPSICNLIESYLCL